MPVTDTCPTGQTQPLPAASDGLEPFEVTCVGDEMLPGMFEPFDRNIRRARDRYSHGSGPAQKLRRDFFDHMLATLDTATYAALQSRQLPKGQMNGVFPEWKYIDSARWLVGKMDHATDLNLHVGPALDILDLGCGPGHFQYICQYLGHRALGLDMPQDSRVPTASRHVYDDLCDFFGVRKVAHRILANQPLPAFGQRFDLVTALMTWFSVHPDGGPTWSLDEWSFFLRDLRDNILKPGGRLCMNIVHGTFEPPVWDYLTRHADRQGPFPNTVHFSDLSWA